MSNFEKRLCAAEEAVVPPKPKPIALLWPTDSVTPCEFGFGGDHYEPCADPVQAVDDAWAEGRPLKVYRVSQDFRGPRDM